MTYKEYAGITTILRHVREGILLKASKGNERGDLSSLLSLHAEIVISLADLLRVYHKKLDTAQFCQECGVLHVGLLTQLNAAIVQKEQAALSVKEKGDK